MPVTPHMFTMASRCGVRELPLRIPVNRMRWNTIRKKAVAAVVSVEFVETLATGGDVLPYGSMLRL